MAIATGGVIIQAQVARNFACGPINSEIELQIDIASSINTAIESGLFTANVSISGEAVADVQNCMTLLNALGYTVTLSGTTLTFTW